MSEVILVASGKGGVGKTVLTANMGAILAQRGASVVLIDLNLGRAQSGYLSGHGKPDRI